MFEKTLSDLVRGIRAHKDNEPEYIGECILEIKKELRTDNMTNKANAVAKLTYLHMMGYDMSWAAFNIIEVMSSSRFVFKRIGYLAASQCFHEGIDVAMLATNLVKKDALSIQTHESSIALSSLSCFLTQDLAMDLANDIMALMISTKPIIRKKSTLAMYCIFMKFPDALRPAFPRLKEKLEDDDPGVQCAAVNVITELARHNPQNYISMAPLFYNLMTSSTNNWMLIKIIKLFGSLCPMEQRLGKKLLDPLTNLVNTTSAMSLLFECVMTMIKGMPTHSPSMQLCVTKLQIFVEDTDQNLKYLGLLALGEIVREHPKLIQPLREMIIDCLEDRDESIRRRALNLLGGMVSRKNLVEIVNRLRQHLGDCESTGYRDDIMNKIVSICSENGYTNVTNFEWYLTVLVELLRVEGIKDTGPIARQILDVTVRVPDVRPFAVKQMEVILENTEVLLSEMSEALYCVAYICGEYAVYLDDPGKTLMCCYKQPRLSAAPAYVQATLIHNSLKLYTRVLEVTPLGAAGDELRNNSKTFLIENLEFSLQSGELEVQERASLILQIVRYMAKVEGKGGSVVGELKALLEGELNPVAPNAQKKVPIPDGLDLDAWINPPTIEKEPEDMPWDKILFGSDKAYSDSTYTAQADSYQATEEEIVVKKQQREMSLANNPHYIKAGGSIIGPDVEANSIGTTSSMDLVNKPINLSIPILMDNSAAVPVEKVKKSTKKGERKSSRKTKKRRGESSEEELQPVHRVNVAIGEMPEGANMFDEDTKYSSKESANPHDKLNINLDAPLRDEEMIPVRRHREVGSVVEKPVELLAEQQEEKKRKKDKKRHRRDKDADDDKDDKDDKKREDRKKESAVEREERKKETAGEREERKKETAGEREERKKETAGEREERKKETAGEREERRSKRRHHKKGGNEPDLIGMGEGEEIDLNQTEQSKVKQEPTHVSPNKAVDSIQQDDLDFWLADENTSPPPDTNGPSGGASLLPPENGTQQTATPEEDSTHRRKHKKHRRDKDKKREKQLPEEHLEAPPVATTTTLIDPNNDILELGFLSSKKKQQEELAADANLRILYEIQQNHMYSQQVVLHLTFCSTSTSALTTLEFNIVDSLNVQAVRPPGVGARDAILLPFQLTPGNSQETQIAFNVNNVLVSQKLKGTLTYMMSSALGSTSEKLDVRISFPVSAFIHTTNFSKNEFMELLGSGELSEAVTSQLPFIRSTDFNNAVTLISTGLHVSIIERVGTGASLYGVTIGQHHVCLLVKDSLQSGISVSVKSSEQILSQSVATEIAKLV